MKPGQFDALARSLTDRRSRRGALAAVVGGALGVAGLAKTDAKKKKPCPPCKKRKKGKCKKTLPDGTSCSGGTCQGGRCLAAVPPPATGDCPSGHKPCDGGCIPSSQCCDNADCPVSGQVCTAARQCVCPAGLPQTCGGACLASCTIDRTLNPETCVCCIKHGYDYTNAEECCNGAWLNFACYGRPTGAECSFHGQCQSENCLCGAFGCGCQ
jgi:hypothetical protein